MICAVGVDSGGNKHVLGFREGATENAEVATALLEDLVERGVTADRKRLFVIDGSKALRKAIDQVFGDGQPVQRCRNHKLRNVLGHLPKDQHDQAQSTIKAAFKLDADEGVAKLKQYAEWLERDWPSAAASLREGLPELFTINRLGPAAEAQAVLGNDEPDRQQPLGHASTHAACEALEQRPDGVALDGRGLRGGGRELPQDHGPRPAVDSQSGPRRTDDCYQLRNPTY